MKYGYYTQNTHFLDEWLGEHISYWDTLYFKNGFESVRPEAQGSFNVYVESDEDDINIFIMTKNDAKKEVSGDISYSEYVYVSEEEFKDAIIASNTVFYKQ
jgi:hypothetical protein